MLSVGCAGGSSTTSPPTAKVRLYICQPDADADPDLLAASPRGGWRHLPLDAAELVLVESRTVVEPDGTTVELTASTGDSAVVRLDGELARAEVRNDRGASTGEVSVSACHGVIVLGAWSGASALVVHSNACE